VTDRMVRLQAGAKPAVAKQQSILIGPGGMVHGKRIRRWLADTLDSEDVKSPHVVTHCFEICLGSRP
jgi:hypothetical protein